MTTETIQIRDNRGGERYFIDNCLIKEYGKVLGVYGIAIYNVIAVYANNDTQKAWPSYNTIADTIGCSRRKVIEMMNLMEDLGMISRSARFTDLGDNDSNIVTLLNRDGWKKVGRSLHVGSASDALPSEQDAPPTHSQPLVNPMHGGSASDAPKQDSSNKTNNESELESDSPKKATPPKKPKATSAPMPEVIIIYRSVFRLCPRKETWPKLADKIGDRLDQWREVCEAWNFQQNNPKNLTGLVDWLNQGIPAYAQNGGKIINGRTDKSNHRQSETERNRQVNQSDAMDIYLDITSGNYIRHSTGEVVADYGG